MHETLLESGQHLHATIIACDFVQSTIAQKFERSKIKEIVTDDASAIHLRMALAILAPFDALIVQYESNRVPTFEMMLDLHSLSEEYKKNSYLPAL